MNINYVRHINVYAKILYNYNITLHCTVYSFTIYYTVFIVHTFYYFIIIWQITFYVFIYFQIIINYLLLVLVWPRGYKHQKSNVSRHRVLFTSKLYYVDNKNEFKIL